MKRYFIAHIGTIYDGFEFNDHYTFERYIPLGKRLTDKEVEKDAIKYYVREGTGEELTYKELHIISYKLCYTYNERIKDEL